MTFTEMTDLAKDRGVAIDDLAKGIGLSPRTYKIYLANGTASHAAKANLEKLLRSLGILEGEQVSARPTLKEALATWAESFDAAPRIQSGARIDAGPDGAVVLSHDLAVKIADVMREYALGIEDEPVADPALTELDAAS